MDSYVTRKRRQTVLPIPLLHPKKAKTHATDEEDTDLKLATLASLHRDLPESLLLDLLLAHDGSVEDTTRAIAANKTPRKVVAGTSYQSSLINLSQKSAKQKVLSQKGKTLHLYSPADVARHTPCSIIHNFLSQDDANRLLQELIKEAKTYEPITFKLFDNIVSSPHTASFYVDNAEEAARQKADYSYNGGNLTDIRTITPEMRRILPSVQEAVNFAVRSRIETHYPGGKKLRYQSCDDWIPNAAFVNCYTGGAESVGYHSDQLTYLGPRAVIGSLSLGVAREFRVRRIIPQDDNESPGKGKSKDDEDAGGQISIHLPHNSLLIMHAEMQEEWKHSITPAQAIDPHPIAGNKRLNVTYRYYKPLMHPRFTPRCKCGTPSVLRVVQRKKANWGRYFWACLSGYTPGKEGCDFFQWAEFDEDGNPPWKDKLGDVSAA